MSSAPAAQIEEKATWEEVIGRLKARLAASGNRESTTGYYLKLIRLVRKLYANTELPELTPGMAAKWRDWMMTTPGRRNKLPSSHYMASLICGLSALWQKWLVEDLKLLQGNPWQDVAPPKTDKLPVRYATDELIEALYKWVGERFGDWPFTKMFLATKAYTSCRLMDLCSLKSGQLQGGILVFPPDLTKGRKERAVPLPKDLVQGRNVAEGELPARAAHRPGRQGLADAPAEPGIFPPATLLLGRDAVRRLPQGEPRPPHTHHAQVPQAGLHPGLAGGHRYAAGVHRLRMQRGHADASLRAAGRTGGDAGRVRPDARGENADGEEE